MNVYFLLREKQRRKKRRKMGRAPCCDKASVKKGPWSPEEDLKLKFYIEKHGTGGNWISLPQRAGLRRCGKSCRLRWLNYLRPDIKHGEFTDDEDRLICTIYASIGSRWSIIAAQLPGRTDNDIKNYWNTKLKKKLITSMPMHLPPPSSSQKKLHQTPTCNKNNFYYLTNLDQTPSISIPQIHQSSKAQKSSTGLIQNGYQMKDNMLSFGGGGGDHQASCCNSSDGSSTITTAEPMGRNYIGQVCITSPSSAQTYHQGIHRDIYNNSGDVNYVWNEEKPNRLWESNVDDQTPIVDYGFEEIKQLISINNMCDDFLVDNEYNTDENFMYY